MVDVKDKARAGMMKYKIVLLSTVMNGVPYLSPLFFVFSEEHGFLYRNE